MTGVQTCALPIYFEGIRYDVGDKFGFIKATIDFALKREDLKEKVQAYINSLVKDVK